MRTYDEIKEALRRPLEFGARKGGSNYQTVQNFTATIQGLLREAKTLDLTTPERKIIQELSQEFAKFDEAPAAEKAAAVKRALEQLSGSGESAPQPGDNPLAEPMTAVHGIGKAFAARLAKKNIHTVEDALFDLPVRYEDRTALLPIAQVQDGRTCTVRGTVLTAQIAKTRKGRRVLNVVFQDASGAILAKWFSYRGQVPDKRFEKGREMIISGAVGAYQGRLEFHHPEIEAVDREEGSVLLEEKIVPIYALTEGLPQRFYRGVMRRIAQEYARFLPDCLPESLRHRLELPKLSEAILRIHCPETDTDLDLINRHRTPSQKRVIFEELFFLALSIELRKQGISHLPARPLPRSTKPGALIKQLLKNLPYALTAAQKRVLGEIDHDLARPIAMNRLLQGDVGAGKTIVALLTALRAIENGAQVALMAPTEILAEQHRINVTNLLAGLSVNVELITGSTPKAERRKKLAEIAAGSVNLVLGTHALLEEDIVFRDLGLVIVDEQHRFGVMQRVALRRKGFNPHALVMTATPIPRTLAMTVYGDLDLSVLDEMPPGRSPIRTDLYGARDRAALYRDINREVGQGRQVYVVYPLIEESETLDLKNAMDAFEELSKRVFPHLRLSLLHGRMKAREKEALMEAFKAGTIQVLVSTTVIEVGIDVPNATLMVIENAERFGLSQLHQLRGRVGRGRFASRCILVSEKRFTPEARLRLEIMVETTDGFRIAEEDLRIRGPGEVLGTRQAGLPTFCYAEIRRDADILSGAGEEARTLLRGDPELKSPEHQGVKQALQAKWKGRLQLSRIG